MAKCRVNIIIGLIIFSLLNIGKADKNHIEMEFYPVGFQAGFPELGRGNLMFFQAYKDEKPLYDKDMNCRAIINIRNSKTNLQDYNYYYFCGDIPATRLREMYPSPAVGTYSVSGEISGETIVKKIEIKESTIEPLDLISEIHVKNQDRQVLLSWNNVRDAEGYNVWVCSMNKSSCGQYTSGIIKENHLSLNPKLLDINYDSEFRIRIGAYNFTNALKWKKSMDKILRASYSYSVPLSVEMITNSGQKNLFCGENCPTVVGKIDKKIEEGEERKSLKLILAFSFSVLVIVLGFLLLRRQD